MDLGATLTGQFGLSLGFVDPSRAAGPSSQSDQRQATPTRGNVKTGTATGSSEQNIPRTTNDRPSTENVVPTKCIRPRRMKNAENVLPTLEKAPSADAALK